jgi:hypothetical protein
VVTGDWPLSSGKGGKVSDDSTTVPIHTETCVRCGCAVYAGLTHHCPTAIVPIAACPFCGFPEPYRLHKCLQREGK